MVSRIWSGISLSLSSVHVNVYTLIHT